MKKTIGIIIAVLAVAGMVFLLAGNKKKIKEQAAAVAAAGGSEVVATELAGKDAMNRSFSSNAVTMAGSELNFVSEISGRVVEIYVDKGSRVAAGTPLLKVDTQLLEADFKAADAAYQALKKDEERFTRSFEAGGITNQQLDNIRTQLVAAESRRTVSKWKLDNAVVKAPIAGKINMRYVEKGALIAPNVPLFEIVDDSRIKVICNVPESKVRLLSVGGRVTAVSSDGTGSVYTGSVRSIGVKTDRGLNFPVEAALDSNRELRVGMYLKVKFEVGDSEGAIMIPRKAVVGSVLAANVYIVKDGKAAKREVKLGDMDGDRIEIVSGVEAGDEVIVAGLMNVSDGTPVRIVNVK